MSYVISDLSTAAVSFRLPEMIYLPTTYTQYGKHPIAYELGQTGGASLID